MGRMDRDHLRRIVVFLLGEGLHPEVHADDGGKRQKDGNSRVDRRSAEVHGAVEDNSGGVAEHRAPGGREERPGSTDRTVMAAIAAQQGM